MKRSAKNYLDLLLALCSLYFMGVLILRAHEIKTLEEEALQTSSVEVSSGWYLGAALLGMLAIGLLAWFFLSHQNKDGFHQTLSKSKNKGILLASSAGGLVFGYICSISLIGSMPSLELQPVAVANNISEQEVEEETDTAQEDTSDQTDTTEDTEKDTDEEEKKEEETGIRIKTLADEETGATVVDSVQTLNGSFSSDTAYQSAVLVEEGGQASLLSAVAAKTGSIADTDEAMAYGLNSALFVQGGGDLSLLGGSVTTTTDGTPGISVSGEATATISDAQINISGSSSPAIFAGFEGGAAASSTVIATTGNDSPLLRAVYNGQASMSSGTMSSIGTISPILSGSGYLTISNSYTRCAYSPSAMINPGAVVQASNTTFEAASTLDTYKDGAVFVVEQDRYATKAETSAEDEEESDKKSDSDNDTNSEEESGLASSSNRGTNTVGLNSSLSTVDKNTDTDIDSETDADSDSDTDTDEEEDKASTYTFTGTLDTAKITLENCTLKPVTSGLGTNLTTTAIGFYIDEANADITLSGCSVTLQSGVLAVVQKADLALTLSGQSAAGSITADKNSSVDLKLTNSSSWSGSLNKDNSGAEVTLSLDSTSSISLTGDCYVDSFENEASGNTNIAFNGYKIYVDGEAISS